MRGGGKGMRGPRRNPASGPRPGDFKWLFGRTFPPSPTSKRLGAARQMPVRLTRFGGYGKLAANAFPAQNVSRSSSGLGHRPFTAATRVRLPYGTPYHVGSASVSDAPKVPSSPERPPTPREFYQPCRRPFVFFRSRKGMKQMLRRFFAATLVALITLSAGLPLAAHARPAQGATDTVIILPFENT